MSIRILGFLLGLLLFFTCQGEAQHSATALLAGYNHVPPVPSPGSGKITTMFRDDTLSVNGQFSGLSSPFYGAYIHYGDETERGNQIFKLSADLNEEQTGGTFDPQKNKWELNNSQRQALAEGRLYINIYSANYQSGELRGQIPPLK